MSWMFYSFIVFTLAIKEVIAIDGLEICSNDQLHVTIYSIFSPLFDKPKLNYYFNCSCPGSIYISDVYPKYFNDIAHIEYRCKLT
uniref:Kappa-scoloptoxin(11)-Ssm3a n=1 Tax=Scolopendra mutilans TaxID=2836329 RepID=TXB3A_SCOMU|nr:RecName: Full=Kappa-scoloptoxin(11)-Ssm3a; Short=Kappa-SLPTX(11)-Ssm3a; AltName: Full=Kappa-scoloptoxin-Ssm3a; Short=Kappa-SLPTX-Ssm3a; Flags: Precursor [Scolopendra mutilans]AFM55005.1 kappa-SLPTX-Ssm3a neurotoxin precursor [Scolopendra subspinipes]